MQGIRDDGYPWDWTSLGILDDRPVRAQIIAKQPGVWAGEGVMRAVTEVSRELCGDAGTVAVEPLVHDGAILERGEVVAHWSGAATSVLAFERPALNLASWVSGVATATRELVDRVNEAHEKITRSKSAPKGKNAWKPPRVTPTRKTLPGYRDASLWGVLSGGGIPHRVSLSGGVLIKENHVAAAGGIAAAISAARAVAPHGLRIEVEVRDLVELIDALQAQADVVMLDNFSPALVRKAMAITGKYPRAQVEVSGGIRESNIKDFVMPGVHVVSVGGLTHSVRSLDLSLLVRET